MTQALESEGIRGEKARDWNRRGAGAILGADPRRRQGRSWPASSSAAAASIIATEGKDVELPAGTVLRVRLGHVRCRWTALNWRSAEACAPARRALVG